MECPLNRFIDATVDNNLAALVKSGFPTPEELQEAKDNLVHEYADAMGDGETKLYLELMKEVAILDFDYKMIHVIIAALRSMHIQYMADDLNELIKYSPRFKFDPKDREQYNKDLDRCANRSKSMLINLTLKKGQLDKMNDQNVNNAKPTREYYYEILYVLEDHAERNLGDNISVHQFATRIKKYNEYCKRQQTKK